MGLIDRIWRVIRANLNSLVSNAEDPEKVLEQAILEMQEDLISLRQAVAQAIATQKRTERDYQKNEATSIEWQKRAQLALQKGDETLARSALVRRQPYLEAATAMRQQLDSQNQIISKLKQDLQTLERKLAEAKAKKDMYIVRARSAKASQQINEMMGKINTKNALSAFERMEEKVNQLEARAEAMAELGMDDLEKQFAALEGGSQVDDQLASLKAQLQQSDRPASLPPDRETASHRDFDPELEQLRSQLRDS